MKPLALALALIIGLGAASCAAEKNARIIAFNDTLVSSLKTSQVPFEAYWEAVAPWYNGKKLKIETLHAAVAKTEEVHREIYKTLLEIEVPEDKLCEAFYEAVMEYFKIDREVIAALKSGTEYIAKHNPPVGKSDLDYVDQLVDPILERREAVFEQVEVSQQRLSEEHDFSLK